MRSLVRAGSLALVLTALVAVDGGAQSAPKFGYVNSQQLLRDAPGRAEAQTQFEREMASFQQQVQRMGDSLKVMIEEYDKQEATLSPTAKDGRQKSIREKEGEYQERVRRIESDAQKRQAELIQPIMGGIMKVIDDIRAAEGYTMIFDVGAANGVIVAADKNLDITDKVMARLRLAGGPRTTTPTSTRPVGAALPAPSGATRPKPPTKP